jgi:hypothetical protein
MFRDNCSHARRNGYIEVTARTAAALAVVDGLVGMVPRKVAVAAASATAIACRAASAMVSDRTEFAPNSDPSSKSSS